MRNLKGSDTDELTYTTERLTDSEKELTVAGGRDGVVRELGKVIHTLQYPTRITRTDCVAMLCVSLDGTPVWGRMDTCICLAESLHCSPETTTTLLISYSLTFWASLVAQSVKNLPAVQETRVQSLGWEDPLEKEMATHSSILSWKISWTEEPGGLQSMASQRVRHD